jgi:hypothetical protein
VDSAIIETLKSAQTVNVVLIFIKDPMVVYLNKKKDEEITVRVQSMFPNCQKYEPCCKEKKGYKITKDGEIGDEVNA